VLTGGLFLLVLALLRGNDQGWSSPAIVTELAGALALVPAGAALGGGSAQAYVDGLRDALWAGSALAAAGAVAAFVLIRSSRAARQVVPVGELVPEPA
jgi:hypothetical protein